MSARTRNQLENGFSFFIDFKICCAFPVYWKKSWNVLRIVNHGQPLKRMVCLFFFSIFLTVSDMDVELEKTLDEISLFLFYANQNKCSLSNQQVWKDKEDQEDHSFCRFCAKGIPEDSYCFQAHLNKSCFQTLVLCWVDRYDYFHELVSQQDFLDGMMKQIMQISIRSCVLFSNIGGQQQWNCSLLSADAFLEAPHWLDVFKQFVQLSFE